MTAIAYPNRTRAMTLGSILSELLPLIVNCFLSWIQTSMERFNRHLANCMLRNERRSRREQWERANALAQLKAMTNGGHAFGSSYSSIMQAQQEPVLHAELVRGDLAWIREKTTGRVFDGTVRKRHAVDGWTEFQKGTHSWTMLDTQFELLARVSVGYNTEAGIKHE